MDQRDSVASARAEAPVGELFEQAKTQFAARELVAAVKTLELLKARAALPDEAPWVAAADSLSGDCYRNLEDFTASLDAHQRAAAAYWSLQDPSRAEQSEFNAAGCLTRLDRHLDAERVYEKLLASPRTSDQGRALISHLLGECASGQGHHRIALERFADAMNLYSALDMPDDVSDAGYWIGKTLVATGDVQAAIERLNSAANRYSSSKKASVANAEWLLAHQLEQSGDLKLAATVYGNATAHYADAGAPENSGHMGTKAGEMATTLADREPENAEQHRLNANKAFRNAAEQLQTAAATCPPEKLESIANKEWALANQLEKSGDLKPAATVYGNAATHYADAGDPENSGHMGTKAGEMATTLADREPENANQHRLNANKAFRNAAEQLQTAGATCPPEKLESIANKESTLAKHLAESGDLQLASDVYTNAAAHYAQAGNREMRCREFLGQWTQSRIGVY